MKLLRALSMRCRISPANASGDALPAIPSLSLSAHRLGCICLGLGMYKGAVYASQQGPHCCAASCASSQSICCILATFQPVYDLFVLHGEPCRT